MRAIVQRVSSARVEVEGVVVGQIGGGLLALVGIHREDGEAQAEKLADKLAGLRIFADSEGKMNRSLSDLAERGEPAGLLLVSNFTVYGDAAKNRRPSFMASAGFEVGKALFDLVVVEARTRLPEVQTGTYGADMQVHLVNDGPVTVILET